MHNDADCLTNDSPLLDSVSKSSSGINNSRLRIAIFTPILYPFYVDLAKSFNEISEVKLFTCGIQGNYPFEQYLAYTERLKAFTFFGETIIYPFEIEKILKFKPDIVIIFGVEGSSGLYVNIFSKIMHSVIISIVEENNVTVFSNVMKAFLQTGKRMLIKTMYHSSDILVAESDSSKLYVEKLLHIKRINPTYVHVHGVNIDRFSLYKNVTKQEAKLRISKILNLKDIPYFKKWFLFIGDPSFVKGTDVLIDALTILSTKSLLEDCIILIPDKAKTSLLKDKNELSEKYQKLMFYLISAGVVILYPPVPYDCMPVFYRAADFILLPSRLLAGISSDRSPNVALEALASGTPLIASSVGGIPTIAGDAAILVKPNDADALAMQIQDVILHHTNYMRLEKSGLERAINELDIKIYSKRLLKMISDYSQTKSA